MARYPGAIYKPITASKGRGRLTVYNRMNFHVAVSEASSLFGYFNQSGIPDSHFYVRRDGKVEQYVDTAYNAFADLEGNDATISVETQGTDKGKWTKAQVKTLIALYAWAIKTHGIAQKLATSSKLGSASKGLSWHRLGVDGNFPSKGILRGRLQRGGGMHYSRAYGKTCPGSAKIKQIPGIHKAALKLLKKPSKPKPSKPTKKRLKPDGYWGRKVTRRAQTVAGTPADGSVTGQEVYYRKQNPGLTSGWGWSTNPVGSQLIYELMVQLKAKGLYKGELDGIAGPVFWRAFQSALGTPIDGKISKKSQAVSQFQANLNKGKLW